MELRGGGDRRCFLFWDGVRKGWTMGLRWKIEEKLMMILLFVRGGEGEWFMFERTGVFGAMIGTLMT